MLETREVLAKDNFLAGQNCSKHTLHIRGHAVTATIGTDFQQFQLDGPNGYAASPSGAGAGIGVPNVAGEPSCEPSLMQIFRVVPGLSLVFYTFNSPDCDLFNDGDIARRIVPASGAPRTMLEVNLCRSGTFRTVSADRQSLVVLRQGDVSLALTRLDNGARVPQGAAERDWMLDLPTSRYRGIGLIADMEELSRDAHELLAALHLDPRDLVQAYRLDEQLFVTSAGEGIDRVAEQLEDARDRGNTRLLRLEALELVARLLDAGNTAAQPPARRAASADIPLEWIRIVRDARNFAVGNLSTRYSIAELCHRFGIGTTVFKNAFREVYGDSYARYMRQLKLARAADLLANGVSVGEAAAATGYESASKFSAAFKRAYGVSPSDYRKRA